MLRFETILLALIGFAAGCTPSNPTGDTSPPGFLSLQAKYVRVPDGASAGVEDIPIAGFTKPNMIGRDRKLILVGVAADGESGIAEISRVGEMQWTCTDPNAATAQSKHATLDALSDEQRAGSWSPGGTITTATFTVDPFDGNPLRLVCGSTQDQSPVTFTTTITVRNGVGQGVSTGRLVFTWAGRPPGPT